MIHIFANLNGTGGGAEERRGDGARRKDGLDGFVTNESPTLIVGVFTVMLD